MGEGLRTMSFEELLETRMFNKEQYRTKYVHMGFPGGSEDKESACRVGDLGSITGLGRSPGEGNGHPLQYSRLESPVDQGAW